MTTAYPLQWPEHVKRTAGYKTEKSKFKTTFEEARGLLFDEIKRFGGQSTVLSTNIPLRKDGFPYATAKEPDDRGVAVYFEHKGKSMVFACDKWQSTKDNIKAIAKTIDALRGVDRWGTPQMVEQTFRGFEALPAPKKSGWRDVFNIAPNQNPSFDQLKGIYKRKAMVAHPDHGGTSEEWHIIQGAYDQAKIELGYN